MTIQTVDFNDLDSPMRFTQSIQDTGFAIVKNHPIDPQLIQRVYDQWFDFFQHDEKNQFLFQGTTHDGFIPLHLSETAKNHCSKDLKEMYHYYRHGRCPKSTQLDTQTLHDALVQLAATLLQWIEHHTPADITNQLSEPLSNMIKNCDKHLFRIIHYPPLPPDHPQDSVAMRAAPHEDINLITLLPAATAKGLQLLNHANEWIDIEPEPSELVVNIADMLRECTNDYYQATTHRVINPQGAGADQSRLSMPLFLHARSDVQLSAQHTANSYRQERYGEIGLLDDATTE